MKPLSNFLYIKRNKGKTFTGMISSIIAISFIMVIYPVIENLINIQTRNNVAPYEQAYTLESIDASFGDKVVEAIKGNENIDRVIPYYIFGIRYTTIGLGDNAGVYLAEKEDIEYMMEKLDLKLIQGKMPEAEKEEIIINKDIAKNKGVKIGDYVGSSVNKYDSLPGKYKVVGLIEGESIASFVTKNEVKANSFSFMLIFPKEIKEEKVLNYIKDFSSEDYSYMDKAKMDKNMEETSQIVTVLDVIAIIYIFIVVFTTSTSKYVQFFIRKEEIGILNAIGFNKSIIVKRAFLEVLSINMLAYGLGFILGLGEMFLFNKVVFEGDGFISSYISIKGLTVALFIPMFATLATIVPINNIINKIDPINIIEKN